MLSRRLRACEPKPSPSPELLFTASPVGSLHRRLAESTEAFLKSKEDFLGHPCLTAAETLSLRD